MKRIIICILAIAVNIINFSCASFHQDQVLVIKQFANNFIDLKLESAYKFLSEKDQKIIPLEDFVKYKQSSIKRKIISQTTYKIVNVNNEHNKVFATIEINGPDDKKIYDELFGYTFSPTYDFRSLSLEKIFEKEFKNRELPTRKVILKFELVKEQAKWKIFFNFEKEIAISELYNKAAQANNAEHFDEAKRLYEEILRIRPCEDGAKKYLKSVDFIIQKRKLESNKN